MPSALLTNGFPVSPSFIDWESVENRPEPPAQSASQPFGYRFRTLPESHGVIEDLSYDPKTQLAHFTSPQGSGGGGGGTTKATIIEVETSLDGTVKLDLAFDTTRD